MAVVYKKHFIKNFCPENPLSVKDISVILKISPEIQIRWGNEYIDFRYTTPLELDEDVKAAINFLSNFENIDEVQIGLYPTDGSYSLLGKNVSKNSIDLRTYSIEEFCEIIKTADKLITLSEDDEIEHCSDLFDQVKILECFDYPKMVTDLEERGWLTTCPSNNFLRVDDRKFVLLDICKTFPIFEGHIGLPYEVDSLGTKFLENLSVGVRYLWGIHLKVYSKSK